MLKQPVITFADTKLIREKEGHSLTAYPDPATKADPWTISYGITGAWVKKGVTITQEESDAKFMELVQKFCKDLNSCLKVELSKNQYLAVLSLMWNIGKGNLAKSTLLKKVNAKDFVGAQAEFGKWNKAAGAVMKGLTTRRAVEAALFGQGTADATTLADAVKNLKEFANKA